MRKFFLLRHEDVHNNSGVGVVAEGVQFDNGMASMTWLTDEPTVTNFNRGIRGIKRLHGHDGKTEIIIEGDKKSAAKYEMCLDVVRTKKSKRKHDEAKDEQD
jgi:hypothetical protein